MKCYKPTEFQLTTKVPKHINQEQGHLQKHFKNFIVKNKQSIKNNADFIMFINQAVMQWNSRDRLVQFHQGHHNCLKMFENTKKKARLLQNKCSSTSQGKKSKEDKKRKSTTVTSTVPSKKRKDTAMSTTQLTSPQSETDPKGHEPRTQASISPPEINNETTALDVEETHTEEE